MIDETEHLSIEELVNRRPAQQRSILRALLQRLCTCSAVKALFVHGSVTRGRDDYLSDLDLVTIVESCDVPAVDNIVTLVARLHCEPVFDFLDYSYPWFGRLRCLHWTTPPLQIDLGLVVPENLEAFFVEPTALVIRDWQGSVKRMRSQTLLNQEADAERLLENVEGKMFTVLIKIKKSLVRGHLWNAIDAVSQLRRLLLRLLLAELDPAAAHRVGREDRDIESYLPLDLVTEIAATAPIYSLYSVSKATERLFRLVVGLDSVQASWQRVDDLRAVAHDIHVMCNGA
jgi:predicted nucleotidyltransferase